MPRYILKFDTARGPRYLEYSTIVDAPVTWGMPLDVFEAYYKERYGTEGARELPERIARVDKTGSSCFNDESIEDAISCNRAGRDETEMTLAQMIEWYCNDAFGDDVCGACRSAPCPIGLVKRDDDTGEIR